MRFKYLKNAVTLELNTEKCTGCGRCTEVCPHQILSVKDGKVKIIDRDRCMECGACTLNCKTSALSVKPGVGCAAAIIKGLLTGSKPSCGCSDTENGCC